MVRLVNGSGPHEGRVEVYHDRRWGTVCDDGWDKKDGDVVCRMLGFRSAEDVYRTARFGQGEACRGGRPGEGAADPGLTSSSKPLSLGLGQECQALPGCFGRWEITVPRGSSSSP